MARTTVGARIAEEPIQYPPEESLNPRYYPNGGRGPTNLNDLHKSTPISFRVLLVPPAAVLIAAAEQCSITAISITVTGTIERNDRNPKQNQKTASTTELSRQMEGARKWLQGTGEIRPTIHAKV